MEGSGFEMMAILTCLSAYLPLCPEGTRERVSGPGIVQRDIHRGNYSSKIERKANRELLCQDMSPIHALTHFVPAKLVSCCR